MTMQTVKSVQLERVDVSDLMKSFKTVVRETINEELKKNPTNHTPPEFMTRKEVAALFGITLPTVHAWINSGLLKAYKIGAKTRFKRSEVLSSPKAMKHDLSND